MTDPTLKITVIIAVRNGAAILQRALDSVFEQTHPNIELIVIDGASTDGTVALIEHNADRIAYWESKPDRGIYHAWNKALDHATGEWICFLGADDRFHAPDVLARIAGELAAVEPPPQIVYGSVNVVTDDGTVVRAAGVPWDGAVVGFPHSIMIPHQATFHHRSLFERHGRFDERFRIAGDYELVLRKLLYQEPRFLPDTIVVDMGSGGISERPSSTYRLLREIHRARYMHGLEPKPAWRSGHLIRALVRIWLTRRFGESVADRIGGAYRFLARKPTERS